MNLNLKGRYYTTRRGYSNKIADYGVTVYSKTGASRKFNFITAAARANFVKLVKRKRNFKSVRYFKGKTFSL